MKAARPSKRARPTEEGPLCSWRANYHVLLRSRGTRERILIWFRRREKSRFFGLQIGRPCRFLQGLWASFSCPSVTSCLLSFVASFVVFDFLGVSLKLTGF